MATRVIAIKCILKKVLNIFNKQTTCIIHLRKYLKNKAYYFVICFLISILVYLWFCVQNSSETITMQFFFFYKTNLFCRYWFYLSTLTCCVLWCFVSHWYLTYCNTHKIFTSITRLPLGNGIIVFCQNFRCWVFTWFICLEIFWVQKRSFWYLVCAYVCMRVWMRVTIKWIFSALYLES